MRRARARIVVGWSAFAGLLITTLAPVASAALPAETRASHFRACTHAACPMSQAKAVRPACHGGGAQPAPAVSCKMASACSCGRDHAPAAPHREPAAVLTSSSLRWGLAPSATPTSRLCPSQPVPVPAPEPPPPRSLTAS